MPDDVDHRPGEDHDLSTTLGPGRRDPAQPYEPQLHRDCRRGLNERARKLRDLASREPDSYVAAMLQAAAAGFERRARELVDPVASDQDGSREER